jgi:lysozyme
MDMDKLISSLETDEGLSLVIYKDSTGNDTIGYGHKLLPHESQLFVNGITQAQAVVLLQNDIKNVVSHLSIFPAFPALNDTRQRVIAEMAFNLGIEGLGGFHKMWYDLSQNDFVAASNDMLSSLWASEVKGRANELANMMKNGYDN